MDTATHTATITTTAHTTTHAGVAHATAARATCSGRATGPARERLVVRRGLTWGPRTR